MNTVKKIFNGTRSFSFFFLGAGFAGALFFFYSTTFIAKEETAGGPVTIQIPDVYKIKAPKVPSNIIFAGEKIPLENFDVYERVDRELLVNMYWHSATILAFKRANRWFPVIEPILKKNNIPDDFKYMAVIESNLSNVVSPAGATGFWQLMEAAAKQYGLEVTKEVDERYHVEKSTEAACKYLRNSYAQFGSWITAAASYNMGLAGVDRQLGRQQAGNYFNLVLNEETSRFVARIIAAKEIFENPQKYGFYLDDDDLYSPLKTTEVTVSGSVDNLADFARGYGINYKILKMYNPWLRDNVLKNPGGKTYTIKLPEKGSVYVIED